MPEKLKGGVLLKLVEMEVRFDKKLDKQSQLLLEIIGHLDQRIDLHSEIEKARQGYAGTSL